MIVSPGRGYIFVHIPKTGGTAMALALEARAMKDDILIGDTPKARQRRRRLPRLTPAGRLWKHSTLADIEGVVARDDFDRYVIFSLVRNPWDRIVSYYHWLRVQSFRHPAVTLAQATDFSGFVNARATCAALRAGSYDSYVRDGAGRLRNPVWLRLERLEDDLDRIVQHLGFRPQVPRANASARDRDWRRYYSDADAALIGTLCAADVAAHGYAFDDPRGPTDGPAG